MKRALWIVPGLLSISILPAAEVAEQRFYRADANIVLFGLTIFSRADVGGGFARLVEDRGNVRLLFVSGSRPDRAHGLNRMGYIEESVNEVNARPVHAEYLGFMTSSGEESLADAKKALHGPAASEVQFVASRGEIDGARARHTVHRLLLPASARWTDARQLLDRVAGDLDRPGAGAQAEELPRGEEPGTFLYTVLSMVRSPARSLDASFLHNGKLFRLHAAKRADEKTGEKLAGSRLIASARDAVELSGVIRNARTGTETTFKVWYDRNSPNALPLRFEFEPKSWLRLVFEAVPVADPLVTKALALTIQRRPGE